MDKTRRRSDRKRTLSENAKLRRENARLTKQIQRLNGAINSMTHSEFLGEEPEEPKAVETPLIHSTPCRKCGKPAGEVEIGKYKFLICTACSFRERKPSQKP